MINANGELQFLTFSTLFVKSEHESRGFAKYNNTPHSPEIQIDGAEIIELKTTHPWINTKNTDKTKNWGKLFTERGFYVMEGKNGVFPIKTSFADDMPETLRH